MGIDGCPGRDTDTDGDRNGGGCRSETDTDGNGVRGGGGLDADTDADGNDHVLPKG